MDASILWASCLSAEEGRCEGEEEERERERREDEHPEENNLERASSRRGHREGGEKEGFVVGKKQEKSRCWWLGWRSRSIDLSSSNLRSGSISSFSLNDNGFSHTSFSFTHRPLRNTPRRRHTHAPSRPSCGQVEEVEDPVSVLVSLTLTSPFLPRLKEVLPRTVADSSRLSFSAPILPRNPLRV